MSTPIPADQPLAEVCDQGCGDTGRMQVDQRLFQDKGVVIYRILCDVCAERPERDS